MKPGDGCTGSRGRGVVSRRRWRSLLAGAALLCRIGWAQAPVEIEGHSLLDALQSVACASGYQLEFRDSAALAEARTVVVHGNVDGLKAREMIVALLMSTDLPFRISGTRVLIGVNAGEPPGVTPPRP